MSDGTTTNGISIQLYSALRPINTNSAASQKQTCPYLAFSLSERGQTKFSSGDTPEWARVGDASRSLFRQGCLHFV